jgi:PAS domain S-box-containing protein
MSREKLIPDLSATVPGGLRPLFEQAEESIRRFFGRRKDNPQLGSIDISGERYMLIRAASLSTEFFDLVMHLYRDRGEEKALQVANNLLFDIAHAIGRADARTFRRKMNVTEPAELLALGPVHFAHSGWGHVVIHPDSSPSADQDYFLHFDHQNTSEADVWLRSNRTSPRPVCVMSGGYSSGWCEECFGISLVTVELECRAAGAERCRFIMAHPSKIREHLTRLGRGTLDSPGAHDAVDIPEFFQRKRIQEELSIQVEEKTAELRLANEQLRLELAEREKAEAALRASEEKFHALFEESRDAIFINSRDGRFIDINQSAVELFGYEREELMTMRAGDLYVDPEKRFSFQRHIEEEGSVRDWELDLQKKSGETLHCLLTASLRRDATGWILGYQGIIHDITERRRALEALKASEEQFHALFEESLDAIYITTVQGKFLAANRSMVDLFGFSLEEMIGMNATELYANADDRQRFQEAIRSTGKVRSFEVALKRKDGSLRDCLLTSSQRYDTENRPVGYQGIIRDITEQKKSEQALRESEEKFRAITGTATDAIILMDNEGKISYWNPAAESMFGYSATEALGQDLHFFLAPREYHEDFLRGFGRFKQEGRGNVIGRTVVLVARNKDGSTFPFEISTSAMQIRGRWHAAGIIRDISERERAHEDLRESRAMLRMVMNTIPQFVFWKDRNSVYLGCNDIFAQAAGMNSSEEIIGKTDYDLAWTREQADFSVEMDNRVMDSDTPEFHLIEPQQQVDGRQAWLDTNKVPLHDAEGQVIGILGTYEDITSRVLAEEEKERMQAQLLQAQKMEAVGTLAGGVAHDFNNLLTAIQGYVDLAMVKGGESDPSFWYLKQVKQASLRAADLTHQLLLFSRKQPMTLSVLSLNSVVRDLLKMLERLIGEDINLATDLEEDLWAVRADSGSLGQVLMNLAVNSRDAMPDGGRLSFQTKNVKIRRSDCRDFDGSRPGDFVRLTVSDTGVGIPEQVVEHIFEPFFSTKGTESGTGLGLAVAFGIVQQHEGWISVESEPGRGTAISVHIPATTEKVSKTDNEAVPLESLSGTGQRILLVEDETDIRDLITEALGSSGYQVFAAASADEAMALYESEGRDFELVFSDVVLTDRSGVQLVEELRALDPQLKVMLCSGYTDEKSQWPVIRRKGYAFLKKPFSLVDMLQRIADILS